MASDEIDPLSRKTLGALLDPYNELPPTGQIEDRTNEWPGAAFDVPIPQDDEAIRAWRLRDMAERLRRPPTPLEIAAGLFDIDAKLKMGI